MRYRIPVNNDTHKLAAGFVCPLCQAEYELPYSAPDTVESSPPPDWVVNQHLYRESNPCTEFSNRNLIPNYTVEENDCGIESPRHESSPARRLIATVFIHSCQLV